MLEGVIRAHAIRMAIAGALAAGGCDVVFGLDLPPEPDAGLLPDATPVAGTPFGPPTVILDLQTELEDDDPSLTADLREIYVYSNGEIWSSTRATTIDRWPAVTLVSELNSASTDFRPSVTSYGLALYFTRGPVGARDILVSHRATRADPWGVPVSVPGDVNTPGADEVGAWSSPDELTLYFEAPGPGGDVDLFIATRSSVLEPFVRAPFTALNSPGADGSAWPSADGTSILFESDREAGSRAIWEAVQVGDDWQIIAHPELDSPRGDGNPWLSPDGRIVVFSSNRLGDGGDDDLFIATR